MFVLISSKTFPRLNSLSFILWIELPNFAWQFSSLMAELALVMLKQKRAILPVEV